MMLKSVVVLSILVALAAAFPATSEYEPSPDLVSLCDGKDASCDEAEAIEKARAALYTEEGDIRYVNEEDRNAVPSDKNRWPNGVMPFTIASSVGSEVRKFIKNAHALITRRTNGCITFVERKTQINYVEYQSSNGGCNSYVGMIGGKQIVNLQNSGCNDLGTAIHEILHALGFHHEHQRTDRDDFIVVDLNNVAIGNRYAFTKEQSRAFTTFDYKSVMIYGEYSFARNPLKKTMWDKTGKNRLIDASYKTDMTNSDATRIKKLYQC